MEVRRNCDRCTDLHTACDGKQPCTRCIRLNIADSCAFSVAKRRGPPKGQPLGVKRPRASAASTDSDAAADDAGVASSAATDVDGGGPFKRPRGGVRASASPSQSPSIPDAHNAAAAHTGAGAHGTSLASAVHRSSITALFWPHHGPALTPSAQEMGFIEAYFARIGPTVPVMARASFDAGLDHARRWPVTQSSSSSASAASQPAETRRVPASSAIFTSSSSSASASVLPGSTDTLHKDSGPTGAHATSTGFMCLYYAVLGLGAALTGDQPASAGYLQHALSRMPPTLLLPSQFAASALLLLSLAVHKVYGAESPVYNTLITGADSIVKHLVSKGVDVGPGLALTVPMQLELTKAMSAPQRPIVKPPAPASIDLGAMVAAVFGGGDGGTRVSNDSRHHGSAATADDGAGSSTRGGPGNTAPSTVTGARADKAFYMKRMFDVILFCSIEGIFGLEGLEGGSVSYDVQSSLPHSSATAIHPSGGAEDTSSSAPWWQQNNQQSARPSSTDGHVTETFPEALNRCCAELVAILGQNSNATPFCVTRLTSHIVGRMQIDSDLLQRLHSTFTPVASAAASTTAPSSSAAATAPSPPQQQLLQPDMTTSLAICRVLISVARCGVADFLQLIDCGSDDAGDDADGAGSRPAASTSAVGTLRRSSSPSSSELASAPEHRMHERAQAQSHEQVQQRRRQRLQLMALELLECFIDGLSRRCGSVATTAASHVVVHDAVAGVSDILLRCVEAELEQGHQAPSTVAAATAASSGAAVPNAAAEATMPKSAVPGPRFVTAKAAAVSAGASPGSSSGHPSLHHGELDDTLSGDVAAAGDAAAAAATGSADLAALPPRSSDPNPMKRAIADGLAVIPLLRSQIQLELARMRMRLSASESRDAASAPPPVPNRHHIAAATRARHTHARSTRSTLAAVTNTAGTATGTPALAGYPHAVVNYDDVDGDGVGTGEAAAWPGHARSPRIIDALLPQCEHHAEHTGNRHGSSAPAAVTSMPAPALQSPIGIQVGVPPSLRPGLGVLDSLGHPGLPPSISPPLPYPYPYPYLGPNNVNNVSAQIRAPDYGGYGGGVGGVHGATGGAAGAGEPTIAGWSAVGPNSIAGATATAAGAGAGAAAGGVAAMIAPDLNFGFGATGNFDISLDLPDFLGLGDADSFLQW